jgi:hypothetical protein
MVRRREILIDGPGEVGQGPVPAANRRRRCESGFWEAPLGLRDDLGDVRATFHALFFSV